VERMKRVAARARVQHGLFDRTQALSFGISDDMLSDWTSVGRLERLHGGVFRVAGAPATWEQDVMAAVLASGGVASHRTAARLWGILETDTVEVTVGRNHRCVATGVVTHRSRDLVPPHVTRRRGIRVTNPMRTLVDLGAVDRWAVDDALERAVIARVCSVLAVERVLDDVARRGRRGAGVLRRVLDDRALGRARPDGLLEARFARLPREHGLPSANFQHRLGSHRVDFAYPDLMVAIEVDGFEVHATPTALQADLQRQNALVAAGWAVLRFTWRDVVRRPGHVAHVLEAFLRQRQRAVA
jgi:very-short-patch-repair endonuclease